MSVMRLTSRAVARDSTVPVSVRVWLADGGIIEGEWQSVACAVAEFPWPLAWRWDVVGHGGELRA
jgi:hypothetical protein